MKLKSLKNLEVVNQNLMVEISGGTMYMESDSTDVVCKSGDSVSEDYGSACGDCVSND